MLLELLPHLSRLMPMADSYLNSRSERESKQQAALNSLAEEVKSGWGRFNAEQTTFRESLQQHDAQLGHVATEVAQLRSSLEALDQRAAQIERATLRSSRWLLANSILVTALLVLLVVRSFR